jgi:hypothetical protein
MYNRGSRRQSPLLQRLYARETITQIDKSRSSHLSVLFELFREEIYDIRMAAYE